MKKRRFKIQRRLKTELPGLGKPGALARRNYVPGQHGPTIRTKLSEYGLRLREKQKVVFHYNIKEKQLIRFIKNSKRGLTKNWSEKLFSMLELRLDNVVFRLGYFPSTRSARQAIVHRHVLVNGKRVDIPSYICKVGDKISLTESMTKNILVEQTKEKPTLELASYLKLNKADGEIIEEPTTKHIPFEFNIQYFIEYYGKVKK